ncbi:hypothetical protein, partial [uncultured Maricaulis sp.]|uniref:hypothetical protein n=1 Tax=uncultured Maricaulis sp. TaxID=174710 RepID=UPI0030DA626C
MSTALLRHARPLLTLRAPLFAGIAAAGALSLMIGGVALFGDGEIALPRAVGGVEPAALPEPASHDMRADTAPHDAGIRFLEPEGDGDVTLSGVREGFEAPVAPSPGPSERVAHGADPADAETRHPPPTAAAPAAHPTPLPPPPTARLTNPAPA